MHNKLFLLIGLWTDWLTFKRDAKLAREEEAKKLREKARRRKELLISWLYGILIVAGVLTGLIAIGFIIYLLKYSK